MMEVMNRSAIVILLSMGERLFGAVSEVGNMLFALIGTVTSMVRHRVNIDTVQSAVTKRLVIEMLSIVVDVMVVAVLQLTELVVSLQVAIVVVGIPLSVMHYVMLSIKSLNVMIINNMQMFRLM